MEDSAGGSTSISPELSAVLEAQKNAILSAVNSQIQGLQTNLLLAQSDLAIQIATDRQPDNYVFRKKGNEQQFSFNRKVAKTSNSALKALEGGNIPKAQEELNKGISLLNNRQKLLNWPTNLNSVGLRCKSTFATIWPTTRPTLRRLRKPRKEPPLRSKHCKRKRGKLVLKVPLLRFHLLAPPELAVRLALFLQLLVIFVPKVDTLTTHSEASTCAFDAVNEDTGSICAPPKTNRCLQDQNLNFLDQYEFEQDIEASSFTQGKLHANFTFWRDTIQASDFVLDIIQNGYKILFMESPLPFSIENGSSALRRDSFVREAISELMARGCVREVQEYPQFCNPLHVAVQSSGKLSLILDLSHLNKFVVKKSVKYENLRTVLQVFSPGMFVFSFDLKSAYHHIDICEEHMKFLSF